MNYYLLVFLLCIIIIVPLCRMLYHNNNKESLINMPSIVLIGDSMLNNSNYIENNQDTKDLSIPGLIKESDAINLYNYAKDSATIDDCYSQINGITQIPKNTTIFISAGGNNIVNESNRSGINNDTISMLFNKYSKMVLTIKRQFPGTTIYLLTLYKPTDPAYSKLYKYIDQWNIKINDFAKKNGLKILQTNILLTKEEDFVYGIEPSKIGGKKIADEILSSTVVNE
jgi:hypothetical protein